MNTENINQLLEKFSEFLKSEIRTETIIGNSFKLGEFTCVPVMSIGLGYGAGGGEGKGNAKGNEGEGEGLGGGLGVGMTPVGFLVTRGDEIQFISAKTSKGLNAAFEKLPDLVEKYLEQAKKKEPEKV